MMRAKDKVQLVMIQTIVKMLDKFDALIESTRCNIRQWLLKQLVGKSTVIANAHIIGRVVRIASDDIMVWGSFIEPHDEIGPTEKYALTKVAKKAKKTVKQPRSRTKSGFKAN